MGGGGCTKASIVIISSILEDAKRTEDSDTKRRAHVFVRDRAGAVVDRCFLPHIVSQFQSNHF
jgi:hypothetical protein